MDERKASRESRHGVSKVKLAIGAASLFLFIVGIKRSYRADESLPPIDDADEAPPEEPRRAPPARGVW